MNDGGIPWSGIIAGALPSIGVGVAFWVAYRAITRADRAERAAQAELDAQDS